MADKSSWPIHRAYPRILKINRTSLFLPKMDVSDDGTTYHVIGIDSIPTV